MPCKKCSKEVVSNGLCKDHWREYMREYRKKAKANRNKVPQDGGENLSFADAFAKVAHNACFLEEREKDFHSIDMESAFLGFYEYLMQHKKGTTSEPGTE